MYYCLAPTFLKDLCCSRSLPHSGLERRVIEAARLGFSRVIVPGGSHPERVRVPNVTLLPCRTLKEAIRITFAGAAAGDDDRGEAGDFDAEEEEGDDGALGE